MALHWFTVVKKLTAAIAAVSFFIPKKSQQG
jgi:hypothetical protein